MAVRAFGIGRDGSVTAAGTTAVPDAVGGDGIAVFQGTRQVGAEPVPRHPPVGPGKIEGQAPATVASATHTR